LSPFLRSTVTPTTLLYTLSLHDALPISRCLHGSGSCPGRGHRGGAFRAPRHVERGRAGPPPAQGARDRPGWHAQSRPAAPFPAAASVLRHRLIRSQPYSDGSELDECEVVVGVFFVSRGDGAEVLEFVEEALDEV